MVSLYLPHELPDSALRTLLRFCAFARTNFTCSKKVSILSNVTPRIFGCITVGICEPLISIERLLFTSFVQLVNIQGGH